LVTGSQSYDQVRDGIATMSTTTKKTCALLLAALTAPALFAAEGSVPLQENTAKGLTVYDSQGKRLDIQSLTIANLKPDTIVRSGAAGWNFVTPFGTVTLTGNSLLVVKSVQQDRPVLYLVDGVLTIQTSKSYSGTVTVKTPVSSYEMKGSGAFLVSSTEDDESAQVFQGSINSYNDITKRKAQVEKLQLVDMSANTSQTQAITQTQFKEHAFLASSEEDITSLPTTQYISAMKATQTKPETVATVSEEKSASGAALAFVAGAATTGVIAASTQQSATTGTESLQVASKATTASMETVASESQPQTTEKTEVAAATTQPAAASEEAQPQVTEKTVLPTPETAASSTETISTETKPQANASQETEPVETTAKQKSTAATATKQEVLPYGIKPIVKSDTTAKDFNIYVAATGNTRGATGGMDIAKLASLLKEGKAYTDNNLLLDAGNFLSGSSLVNKDSGKAAKELAVLLGYDAMVPGPADFAYGTQALEDTAAASGKSGGPLVLSANALDESGSFMFQPYQVYDYNGYRVLVTGLTGPNAVTDALGVKLDSQQVVDKAQAYLDEARKLADYVIVLSNVDTPQLDGSDICNKLKGIDLFIDGASEEASSRQIGSTSYVATGEGLQDVALVDITVKDGRLAATTPTLIGKADVDDMASSKLAKTYGLAQVSEDAQVKSYLAGLGIGTVKSMPEAPTLKTTTATAKEKAVPAEPTISEPTHTPSAAVQTQSATKQEALPYGIKPIAKSDTTAKDFDIYVAATGNTRGAAGGMDIAKLASLLKEGRAYTDNNLLLDAGNFLSGSSLVNKDSGKAAKELAVLLGYDAMVPGSADFAYGTQALEDTAAASGKAGGPLVLSANALDESGSFMFQPYQVYDYNGYRVLVTGLTGPNAVTDALGVKLDSQQVVDKAQAYLDEARKLADYVIVLSNVDTPQLDGSDICSKLKGIDLFIDGASEEASSRQIGSTSYVATGEGLQDVALVDIAVKDGRLAATTPTLIGKADVDDMASSKLAKTYGLAQVSEDAQVKSYLAGLGIGTVKSTPEAPTMGKATVTVPKVPAAPTFAGEPMAIKKFEAKQTVSNLLDEREKFEAQILPYGIKPIVKSNTFAKDFDIYVAATGNTRGAAGGMDIAKLASLLKEGRAYTDNNLLLDAGNFLSGSNLVNKDSGKAAKELAVLLGYDAMVPGPADFAYGTQALEDTAAASGKAGGPAVLSANALDESGSFMFQPYQVYDYNGYRVLVTGLTGPNAVTDALGVKLDSQQVVGKAQAYLDEARKLADYVIVLSNVDTPQLDGSGICSKLKGIDLFIDGASEEASSRQIGTTSYVATGEGLQDVALVDITVKDGRLAATTPTLIGKADVDDMASSKLAKTYGLAQVSEDAQVKSYLAGLGIGTVKSTPEVPTLKNPVISAKVPAVPGQIIVVEQPEQATSVSGKPAMATVTKQAAVETENAVTPSEKNENESEAPATVMIVTNEKEDDSIHLGFDIHATAKATGTDSQMSNSKFPATATLKPYISYKGFSLGFRLQVSYDDLGNPTAAFNVQPDTLSTVSDYVAYTTSLVDHLTYQTRGDIFDVDISRGHYAPAIDSSIFYDQQGNDDTMLHAIARYSTPTISLVAMADDLSLAGYRSATSTSQVGGIYGSYRYSGLDLLRLDFGTSVRVTGPEATTKTELYPMVGLDMTFIDNRALKIALEGDATGYLPVYPEVVYSDFFDAEENNPFRNYVVGGRLSMTFYENTQLSLGASYDVYDVQNAIYTNMFHKEVDASDMFTAPDSGTLIPEVKFSSDTRNVIFKTCYYVPLTTDSWSVSNKADLLSVDLGFKYKDIVFGGSFVQEGVVDKIAGFTPSYDGIKDYFINTETETSLYIKGTVGNLGLEGKAEAYKDSSSENYKFSLIGNYRFDFSI
jgi:2',3'-cyclic-nucleotide 2'-phosphodiesterase (5'-nucleotidase family)